MIPKNLITVVILLSFSLAYAQSDDLALDYQRLVQIVQTGDTTTLKEALGSKELKSIEHPDELPLLFYACTREDSDMLHFLLAHGEDPNSISRYGTPAHWAAEKENLKAIDLLLRYGFDPRIESMSYWVNKYESGEIISPEWMSKLVIWLKENDKDYHNFPYMQYTDPSDPLILSAAIVHDTTHSLVLARALIEKGIQIDLVDKRGMTALLWAIYSLNPEAVSLLIAHGADVNLPMYSKRFSELTKNIVFNNNLSPLHFLLYQIQDRPEILETDRGQALLITKYLIQAGADPNVKTKNDPKSVFEVAKELNDRKFMKLLSKSKIPRK